MKCLNVQRKFLPLLLVLEGKVRSGPNHVINGSRARHLRHRRWHFERQSIGLLAPDIQRRCSKPGKHHTFEYCAGIRVSMKLLLQVSAQSCWRAVP